MLAVLGVFRASKSVLEVFVLRVSPKLEETTVWFRILQIDSLKIELIAWFELKRYGVKKVRTLMGAIKMKRWATN